jgi:hypothetical protein
MPKRVLEKLRRFPWTYKQELTRVPRAPGAPVSDLFFWRSSSEWKTLFELTDMRRLFAEERALDGITADVEIILFDRYGRRLTNQKVKAPYLGRNIVDISALVPESGGAYGTFCVFHQETPPVVAQLGSHLAERGYASFVYRDSPVRGYVHGNLDAIAKRNHKCDTELLGGAGPLIREYRLQHQICPPGYYEVGIVNPNIKPQKVECRVLQISDGEKVLSEAKVIPAGGVHVFKLVPATDQSHRIVIRSHLVMARPLIFHITDCSMDVLHG